MDVSADSGGIKLVKGTTWLRHTFSPNFPWAVNFERDRFLVVGSGAGFDLQRHGDNCCRAETLHG